MKPALPKGMRDFGPEIMLKRNYIIETIKRVFENFGYQPLQTPAMEKLTTLTGKYGEEGDKLLFKVLNQGQKVLKADHKAFEEKNAVRFANSLAERGLRYDLTIPFARFVVMNQSQITFPFKRYQVQAVWRGDRPQKGRYREFYQCDADVVGSNSLLNEAELTQIFDMVYNGLGLNVTIKINNRKILAGMAEVVNCADQLTSITIAIDKLDKIGLDGVVKELGERGIPEAAIETIKTFLTAQGDNAGMMALLKEKLANSEIGMKGVEELETLMNYLNTLDLKQTIELDITLARGLDYYTGTIFEVKANDFQIGSISAGGRYDDLTGTFGLKGVSGVGISFGLDRIYDVMEGLGLFQSLAINTTKVLFINFGGDNQAYAFQQLQTLRKAGIAAEIYPDAAKMKKQMKYANAKKIPWVIFTGDAEIESGNLKIKNMETGEQEEMSIEAMLSKLSG